MSINMRFKTETKLTNEEFEKIYPKVLEEIQTRLLAAIQPNMICQSNGIEYSCDQPDVSINF